jgi:YVTN family beta-propeller protein
VTGTDWHDVHAARRHAGQLFLCILCFVLPSLAAAADGAPPREAFTTNQISDSVSVVDLATLTSVHEIKISGKPAGIALSPDQRWVYVTAPEGRTLFVIDAVERKVARQIEIGQGPLGIAVHPQDGRIFVADWHQHKLSVVDPGKSPSGVAITPDGKTILTADRDSNEVSVIDAATLKRIKGIKTGERPFGVTINQSGTRAYTANVGTDDISVLDLASGAEVGRVKVGHRPYAVALAQGRIFVTDQHGGTVSVIDEASLKLLKQIPVGGYPEGIQTSPDGLFVYVACWDANTLEKIDTATLTVVGKADVGEGPRAFGAFLR